VLLLGGSVEFADINPRTLTQDPWDMIARISNKTKVLVAVHLGGWVDVDAMLELRKVSRRGIRLIEDAAQALGAEGLGKGDFTCFSFQAIKALSTGDGGMLVCRTKDDADHARRLRWFDIDRRMKAAQGWQAWTRRGITFDQEEPGYKYQPTDLDAAIGLAGLETFDQNQAHRQRLARLYLELLEGVEPVLKPGFDWARDSRFHSFWLLMVKVAGGKRDDLAEYLFCEGIETNVAHLRNDIFTVFGPRREDLPFMDQVENEYICLPLNNKINDKEVRYVCSKIKEWL